MSDLSTPTRHIIAEAFTKGLPLLLTTEPKLAAAIRHVLNCPGSLLRSALAYELAVAFQVKRESAIALATGIEYMHTASLLFDDMPAMDDAIERRSDACVHVLYGEAACTLAALALINRGYALLWKSLASAPARQKQASIQIEKCFGIEGMLTGQSRDLHHSGAWSTREVFLVSMGKTAALVRLTLALPALLGKASRRQIHQLNQLGVYWGLSYQILDDLKDVHFQKELSGKTSHRDAKFGRPNLALVESNSQCIMRTERLLQLSESVIHQFESEIPQLRFLSDTQVYLQSELNRIQRIQLSACA